MVLIDEWGYFKDLSSVSKGKVNFKQIERITNGSNFIEFSVTIHVTFVIHEVKTLKKDRVSYLACLMEIYF